MFSLQAYPSVHPDLKHFNHARPRKEMHRASVLSGHTQLFKVRQMSNKSGVLNRIFSQVRLHSKNVTVGKHSQLLKN